MNEIHGLAEFQRALEYRRSPVHQAVEIDDLEELTRLLDAGHNPNEFDAYNGWTPLLHAIDGEADGAVQTGTPLQAACTAVLLAYGADPELAARDDGLTPMHLAVQVNHELAVRLLEAHIARRRSADSR
ncbi:ankyrin repeat domain-containing protein [Streptomyces sp. NPDC094447]|uniref:ankyrin repeat domain-containing protein n=1 Tax=Streptomyces sp. NPDC094447 TaxID=3366062 RepID=UPI00380B4558